MNSNSYKILVIDDDKFMCDSCLQVYLKEGYSVETTQDGITGLQKIRESKPDIVLVDLKMPGISGMEVLEKINRIDPNIVSIVITGYATIDSAVEAMKKDAYDFLPKPFTPNELRLITKKALEKRKLLIETNRLRKEKEQMRERFISMVSHQLRTPLVAVQQYFEVILAGIAGSVTKKQKQILQRSKIRIDELIKLIKDWLDFSKINADKLVNELTPTSLPPILIKSFDLIKPIAKQKNITLKINISENLPMIIGNKETLEQVFINLLENGIRYNRNDCILSLKAKRYDKDDKYIVVEISDTGIGISQEHLPYIFEQFYQADKNKKTDGTGLGLSIVKRIIDAHSGSIKVKSELGRGSTFTILLPRQLEE